MRHVSATICLTAAILSISAGTRGQERFAAPSGAAPGSRPSEESKEGYASYYGRRFHGRTTASGTVFDNRAMLAAHPVYPFGTVVRVTNLSNQESVDVEIVDRGPTRAARRRGVIIDLSRAAAQSLGFMKRGRTRVRVEVLSWGEPDVAEGGAQADNPAR